MVVVIVGDDQQIDLRHPFRPPRIVAGESFIDKGERRRVIAEHRVDQDAFSRQLQVPGGVAEPDHHVLPEGQRRQIGLHQRQRLRGTGVFPFGHQEIPPRRQHIFLPGEPWRGQLVMELAVPVVGRRFHLAKLCPLRRLTKTGIEDKRQCRCCCE